jgi:hypothetical protein
MRSELVIVSLLNVAAVTAIVGNRMARVRLPQNTSYPALVYEQISGHTVPPIDATAGGNIAIGRVQVTALSRDMSVMDSLLEAVRVACSFKNGAINTVTVISVMPDAKQPVMRDDDAAVFYQSMDFLITHLEP